MDKLFDIVIIAAATYRIAHLISAEDGPWDACARLRHWAETRYPPAEAAPGVLADHWVVRGLHCALCVSFWTAAVMLSLWHLMPALVMWLAIAGMALVIHRGDPNGA